jgi:ribosomal protein S18 acetylase RimI-like enzyme
MDRAESIEVRAAREADLERLAPLLITQLREHGIDLPDAELEAAAAGLLRRPRAGRFVVACDGAEMVGFAALSFLWTLEHGGRAAWLDELYVLPARRQSGIGTMLLRAAVALAAEAGCAALDLEIDAHHRRVASLYEREGFRELGRTRWARPLKAAPQPTAAAATERSGGCFCGAVRYRIRGAVEVTHCHCSICRRTSGAPFVTWATVARAAFEFTRGAAAELRATEAARRTFCSRCGTPLTFELDAHPQWIDVTVGSLDAPESAPPVKHTWTASRLAWLHLDDDLPRHPGAGDGG